MRRSVMVLAALCCLATAFRAAAQPSAFSASVQRLAVAPAELQSLSVVDSCLYASSSRVMLLAERKGADVVWLRPDTLIAPLAADMCYAVRRPGCDELYYVAPDKKGSPVLYLARREGKKLRTKRVDTQGMAVEGLTFSTDGRIMVFSSRDGGKSLGGYDLWYSVYDDGKWSAPANMGERVNTQADEICPHIAGDFLFFSTNGRPDSRGRLNIYATRLIADGVVGDTVGMLQIGRSRVQRLPEPFNRQGQECFAMVADTVAARWYWCAGHDLLSASGPLHAEHLWGFVGDENGKPIPGAHVSAFDGRREVCSTVADKGGYYHVVLPAGSQYRVVVQTDNRFQARFDVAAGRDPSGLLIGERRRDVVLDGIPVGRPLVYADIFGPGASVELSGHGQEALAPLITFLCDNPTLSATFTLRCDLLADAEFNALLTARRIEAVEDYIAGRVPQSVGFEFRSACAGGEGCADGSGESRLSVVLN
ncbi:MAG: carboxypeptidase regulatory-like domain-containing protein [Bacteroidales bacterium]|nr:carboxypeptidase regulatory-like domain-containing protein [Bacteroidales bacterium]